MEIMDIESSNPATARDVATAQPDRHWFWASIERVMFQNPNKNADGLVATAEPHQGSRCIFLCFIFFIGVVIVAITITTMKFSYHFHPTNMAGRALQVTSRVVGIIGMVITILWLNIVIIFVDEIATTGDPDDPRCIDFFI
jgi:hypothetical protein